MADEVEITPVRMYFGINFVALADHIKKSTCEHNWTQHAVAGKNCKTCGMWNFSDADLEKLPNK